MPPPTLPADIADRRESSHRRGSSATAISRPSSSQRDTHAVARVVAREPATLCGRAWFDETFRQLDPRVADRLARRRRRRSSPPTAIVCELQGPARSIVTGERTALNFLQTLSGTATAARSYADLVAGTRTRILDTRKTLPGLRLAQKYAVRCGGGENHRIGLFDAVLIKENHIAAVGSVSAAVAAARRRSPQRHDRSRGRDAGAAARSARDRRRPHHARRLLARRHASCGRSCATRHGGKRQELEASGSVDAATLTAVAATGVDFVSIGAITKHVRAIDFSMRFV